MRTLRSFVVAVLFACTVGTAARAQDFLNDAQHMFFDQAMRARRFGIEIEFGGLSDDVIEKILIEKLGAQVRERLPSGEVVYDAPMGEVRLKIEGQAWRYEKEPERYAAQQEIDRREAPREIVFPPVDYSAAESIQSVGLALKKAGATGTTKKYAVSTQVNVEWPDLVQPNGENNEQAVDDLVNLMRVYSNPEHARQIEEKIHVPAIRREYILDYSPGMLRKLGSAHYKPTARELFDDYFYRQSLELLGFKNAWRMDMAEAKALLLAQPDPVVPAVAKMLRLRVSSVLLKAFPNDPLSVAIVATRWAKPMPLVEFREMNTDFDIQRTIEECLGIVRSVEVFGDYEHDELVSRLTGIDPRDLGQLRADAVKLKGKLRVVRYALYDPKTSYLEDQNTGVEPGTPLWIQLDPDHVARKRLVVDGNSVVYGRRTIHRDTLVGKHNPGLENALIQQVMENKLFEAKIFGKYAKSSMARALTLRELVAGSARAGAPGAWSTPLIHELVHALNVEFPNGWVMKGAWDLSTESMFISDQLDLPDLIAKYRDGFEAFRAKTEKTMRGEDPEDVLSTLKKHPGFRGWKIMQMLAQPDLVFFQERLRLKGEYRVEAQGGKVLGQGSTIDRYSYRDKKYRRTTQTLDPTLVERIEAFTQNILDALPEALRYLPYGFDIALLENGEFKMIESNPGGNSSFLEENPASMAALNAYLKKYPKLIESGAIKLLTAEEQMRWIKSELADLGLDAAKHYPGIALTDNDVRDAQYPPVVLRGKRGAECERWLTIAKP